MPMADKKALSRAERLANARNRRRVYAQSRSSGLGPGRPGTQPGFSVHTCHEYLRLAYRRLYWRVRKDTANKALPKDEKFSVAQFIVAHEDEIMQAGPAWLPPARIEYIAKGKKIVLQLNVTELKKNKAEPVNAVNAIAKLHKKRA